MEFLSSPIHNYSYETFDDAFFELPKEIDFELNDDFRDSLSYSMDEDDDLNDGMYGVWNAKHPWSINNNSNSLYNSNLHLDFIGGDPESATMVNPNIVIPNSFRIENNIKRKNSFCEEESSNALNSSVHDSASPKVENEDFSEDDSSTQVKKIKSKFSSVKENLVNGDCTKSTSQKNGIRVLKPTVIESNLANSTSVLSNTQIKNENSKLKSSGSVSTKSVDNAKCFYYQNDTFYPKPAFSYSCLIAMALKNSKHGCLPVAEIYNFMCNHFPYFKTAPNGWKNSVRHNLSLNKCFEKIEKPAGSTQRKGCLWALNPSKAAKLEEEVQKCSKKDVVAIKKAMEYPEHLELLERGELKSLYDTEHSADVDDEDEEMDTNEEDTEGEEPGIDDEDSMEQLRDMANQNIKESSSKIPYSPVLNVSENNSLPELQIEVDGSIYDEFIGTIKNEQLYAVNESELNTNADNSGNSLKKIKKYYIHMNGGIDDKVAFNNKTETENFDHYDINNFLRLENEMKLSTCKKTPPRFTKRIVPNSRIRQIKFKTWD